jgi:hypothetical protein
LDLHLNLMYHLKWIYKNISKVRLADMAKLVDALDLGPSNFCFESSSLSIRILKLI